MSRHEESDVAVRPIATYGALLFLLVLVVGVAMAGLLHYYERREARRSPPASPLAESYGRKVPPEPRLQTDPRVDLERLHQQEHAILDGYGWIDRPAGVVRIPIDRAISLFAERSAERRKRGGKRP
jgi:hypothetical protein